MFGSSKSLSGREKAEYLVREIGKRVHADEVRLDPNGDCSFGEFGFHFNAERNLLVGRVFIAKAYLDEDDPEGVANFRKVAVALEDPNIGGLFEHGGGHFILDEKKRKYFLTKAFPVESSTPQLLWTELEDLVDLGARWSMKWFGHVADITHGHEQPPSHSVTRKNDPYPRS